jgi:hypothetical protein
MFDPPLTQDADKRTRDLWIWVATIIAVVMVLTTTGLFATVVNQSTRDADRNVNIAQSSPTSHHSAR